MTSAPDVRALAMAYMVGVLDRQKTERKAGLSDRVEGSEGSCTPGLQNDSGLYGPGGKQSGQIRAGLQAQMNRLEQKREGLRDMRALGDISREEFLRDTRKLEEAEMRLREQLQDLDAMQKQSVNSDLEQIRATLEQWVDLSAPVVPEALVEQFILQVLLIDDNTFNWTLDLSSQTSSRQRRLKPSEIAFALYHRAKSNEVECLEDTELERYILQPQEILSFSITAQEAKAYCQSIGMRFFAKKWHDKTITVSIG